MMKLWTADGEWEVPEDLIDAYMMLHRDADKQFAKMVIWLTTNKAKRPKNPERFIANWFRKNQKAAEVLGKDARTFAKHPTTMDRNIAAIASLTGAKRETFTITEKLGS